MRGELSYLGIAEFIAEAMDKFKNIQNPTLEQILETDAQVRSMQQGVIFW